MKLRFAKEPIVKSHPEEKASVSLGKGAPQNVGFL